MHVVTKELFRAAHELVRVGGIEVRLNAGRIRRRGGVNDDDLAAARGLPGAHERAPGTFRAVVPDDDRLLPT